MNNSITDSSSVQCRINDSVVRITFGDLFSYDGIKAIPVSRHFFETEVAERSLLHVAINKLKQSYRKGELKRYEKQLLAALEGKEYTNAPVAFGTMDVMLKPGDLSGLRQVLATRFSEGELQDLCFDLRVDYDSLPGQGKNDKARELIAHLHRRDHILELIRTGEQVRPDISWSQTFQMDGEPSITDRLYPLGTTAFMKSGKENFLFFAITWTELRGYIPDDNCSVTNMWVALEKFWHEARKYAHGEAINVPLIGSGITGINLKPIHILELNLLAILNSITRRGKITSNEIRIVLYPPKHSKVDLKSIQQIWG